MPADPALNQLITLTLFALSLIKTVL